MLPEDLYPWLNLVSGLLVLGVGAGVLRSHLRRRRHSGSTITTTSRPCARPHSHDHEHGHSHAPPEQLTWRGLLAMGASAGLIPCPSALVVLLGAIAQRQIALGMLLIVAFSAGLAATLTGLGLAVVLARRALGRLPCPSGLVTALPAALGAADRRRRLRAHAQAVPQLA